VKVPEKAREECDHGDKAQKLHKKQKMPFLSSPCFRPSGPSGASRRSEGFLMDEIFIAPSTRFLLGLRRCKYYPLTQSTNTNGGGGVHYLNAQVSIPQDKATNNNRMVIR
jgi:hypothetical protein